jgi:hypothetical protein
MASNFKKYCNHTIKQLRREMKHIRRKNQRTEALYFPEEYEVFRVVAEEHVPDKCQINEEHEEIGEILKRLMLVMPSF